MKRYIYYILILLTGLITVSCHKHDDPKPVSTQVKRTVLVYAVAANNLSTNLDGNMRAMLTGMQSVDMDAYRWVVCRIQYDYTTKGPTPQELLEIVSTPTGPDWKVVKTYDNSRRSVDPERISEVIQDVRTIYPSESYGLIFWSHSDAWNPSSNYSPPQKSFGQEKENGKSYYCEIPDLARAVPYDFADFIWFDSCYMANIESAYEFRDKCHWFVGSVIELDSDGMPYNITVPHFLSDNLDIAATASASYKHIEDKSVPVSMSVFDMTKIESVADASAKITANFTPLNFSTRLQYYSRLIAPVLYDFGQYMSALAAQNGTNDADLRDALEEFIVYKAITPYGWGRMDIDQNLFSGVSCNNFRDEESKADTFYRSLAWYKRVFEQNIN